MSSVAVTIKAKKVLRLSRIPGLTITSDSRVKLAQFRARTRSGRRPSRASVLRETDTYRGTTPTIAIVDSGIDKNRPDFDGGARIIGDRSLTTRCPNSPGDGRGHGTFVAGIAAGSAPGLRRRRSAAPRSSTLDVMDDNGMARTSDVIAAAEWIYENKNRVQHPGRELLAPLDRRRATSRRTRSTRRSRSSGSRGVVVVVAAGNYGSPDGPERRHVRPRQRSVRDHGRRGRPRGQRRASGGTTCRTGRPTATRTTGFAKPEIVGCRPLHGRAGPVRRPARHDKPENVIAAGYMRLSGTSFASPVVAGAAAQILARHPNWTPDRSRARSWSRHGTCRRRPPGSAGVGEVNAYRAPMLTRAPNPNAALNRYSSADPAGGSTPVLRRGQLDGRGQVERRPGTRSPGAMPPGATPPGRLSVLVGRFLERRLLDGRHLERRARSGGRHLGGRRGGEVDPPAGRRRR